MKKELSKKEIRQKEANAAFNKLTKVEKRKSIAKDVIAQIKAEKIIIEAGNAYCEMNNIEDLGITKPIELQSILPKLKCTCCGKGAMFLSSIRKSDNFKIKSIVDDEGLYYGSYNEEYIMRSKLKMFPKENLDLIEVSFEVKCNFRNSYLSGDLQNAALNFGSDYKEDSDRLIAIMQNIIKNPKGLFSPEV